MDRRSISNISISTLLFILSTFLFFLFSPQGRWIYEYIYISLHGAPGTIFGRSWGALGSLLGVPGRCVGHSWTPQNDFGVFSSSEGRFGILSDRIALQPSTLYWGAISGGLSSASPQRRCNNDDSRMSRANANNDTTTT